MISTGIIRSIDNLGRIVLPKELRSSYGITPDTPLEIMTEGEMILLRKYQPADACIFCNEVKPGTVLLHGRHSSRAYKPNRKFFVSIRLRAGHAPPLRGGKVLICGNRKFPPHQSPAVTASPKGGSLFSAEP